MRIAIYSPYLDTFGGGEKYMMTIAEVLSANHTVEVFLDQHLEGLGGDYLKKELSKRFNLDLKTVEFIKAPIGKGSSFVSRTFFLKKYDVLFYLTDGSIFYPTSKKNILHIQSPLEGQAKNIWGKFKLKGWDLVIYNSKFTKCHASKLWQINSEVVYPPIDVDKIEPLKKKRQILSVGRFYGYLKGKKHELLIEAFKKLVEIKKIQGWSLHLAGAASSGDEPYLNELKKLAEGLPINFYPNIGYDKLVKLYGESSIYWHMAGFGEDDPTKMEHFGISTVEAMAGGCVPIVIGKGGQQEIIDNKKSGLLWEDLDQLLDYTISIIMNKGEMERISKEAVKRSKLFTKNRFQNEILRICNL